MAATKWSCIVKDMLIAAIQESPFPRDAHCLEKKDIHSQQRYYINLVPCMLHFLD